MNKHTSGPLFAGELIGNGWVGIYTAGQAQIVAEALAEDVGEDAAKANATLFAAAPELLEAVKAALVALDLSDQDYFDDGRLTKSLRAAIAKATGKDVTP